MRKFNFTNEDAKKMYETKIEKLKKIADERVDDTQYCWDETVKKYAIISHSIINLFFTFQAK